MSNNNSISNNRPSLLIVLAGVLISISLIAYSVYATSIGSTITTSGLIVSGNTTTTNLVITTNSQLGTVSSGTWQGTPIADPYVTSSLTISGGTINNTPIGLTIPSTGAFTTLETTGTSTLATTTISGKLGIGTTSPSYTLDVAGNIRATKSITSGINVKTLTGNKTLAPGTDEMYQYLDPNGATRTITLATSTANAGDRWVIKNNGAFNTGYNLTIQQGGTTLESIYAKGVKQFIFDGTNWIGAENGTRESGTAIGSQSIGYGHGATLGYGADGHDSGAAVGYGADGHGSGAAVGYGANGNTYGAAIGPYASGNTYGSAIGYGSWGYNYGVGIGFDAKGANNGLSIGYYAGHSLDFTTLTTNKNTLIGYKAGDTLTTGNHNLLIGYDIDVPATTTSNYLSIGNLIFGTGMNATGTAVSNNGKVGIGTSTPQVEFHVVRTASSTIRVGDINKTSCLELGDSDGSGITYITVNNGVLTATTTKPTICE